MPNAIDKPNGGRTLSPEQADKVVEYIAFGSKNVVRLTVGMVRNTLCKKSKMGHMPSDVDCLKFIKRCQSQQIDPWLDECYLVGYDKWTKDRQCVGADFTMIIGYGVYLKRAEINPNFDGYQSGVVVMQGSELVEREGDLVLAGEVLVGGWCKVYRKNLRHPIFKRASLSTNMKNTEFWTKDPGMMITKTAEADAFRAAFPSTIGHLYMEQEIEAFHGTGHEEALPPTTEPAQVAGPKFGGTDTRVLADRYRTSGLNEEYGLTEGPKEGPKEEPKPKAKARKKEPEPEPVVVQPNEAPDVRGRPPEPPNAHRPDPDTPHAVLEEKLAAAGHDWSTLVGWACSTGNYPDADTHATLSEVPRAIVERWLRAWSGLKLGLDTYKAGGGFQ